MNPPKLSQTTGNMTRRQALINYLVALYSQHYLDALYSQDGYCGYFGYFNGFLRSPPCDSRVSTAPDITDVKGGYTILEQIDALDVIDWSNATKLLRNLVNDNPHSMFYRLVNASADDGPDVFAEANAIELFPKFGIDYLLDIDAISDYLSSLQDPCGGFIQWQSEEVDFIPDIITTYFALSALNATGHLDKIDLNAAVDFLMSCYMDDGGFSISLKSKESELDLAPLGLMSLKILGRSDLIRTNKTLTYLLRYWDNTTGRVNGGSVRNTRRFLLSLKTLGKLDIIDADKVVDWVVSCQTSHNGAFLPFPYPEADYEDERLEWALAAVDALYMLNRTDALEETIYVEEAPVYEVPQWYIDYINRHFGTTTTVPNIFHFPVTIPAVILSTMAIMFGVSLVCSLPAMLIIYSERKERARRKHLLNRRRRKKGL